MQMIALVKMLVFAAGTMLATSAFAQSAREVRGPSPNVAVKHEGRLPPLSDAVGWLNSAPLALAELRPPPERLLHLSAQIPVHADQAAAHQALGE